MPNKKISQLSQISPVPTGGLMIVANSGVSRSASVKDVAEAISSTNTTFSGLTDTPDGISGDMFVVGHPDGTGLTFSKNLHLGTGTFLDKTVGGTISGTVTMATGEKIEFANSENFINSAGDNLAFRTDGFIKLRSTSGTNIYQLGGSTAKINFFTGFADEHKIHVIETTTGQYISSGLNHVLHSDTDISGKIFQSGKEIKTGDFALSSDISDFVSNSETGILVGKNESGTFVGDHETGILVGKNESGTFVGDHETGIFVEAAKTGDFVVGSGVPNNISAKWTSTGLLTSGITIDNGEDFFPNTTRVTDLGKSSNRWKTIHSERIVMNATGSTDDGLDAYASLKSEFTGAAYAEFIAMNSDSDTLKLGISSTGKLLNNIGSGNYYLKGAGASGKQLVIGDKHDILFFANTGISVSNSESRPGGQNPSALKIHTSGLVTFSEAFTMPTGDGSSNQFLKTDGAGNVTWASAITSTGNLVGQEMTGDFVDIRMTGDLVDTDMTGILAQFFTDLDDTPASLGSAGQSVVVAADGNSLTFSGVAGTGDGGGGELTGLFTSALNDTPSTYAGHGGSLVVVKAGVDGLEFKGSGDFVGASETGDFVDIHKSGNLLVGINMTGNLVDQDMTGILVHTGDTGNFVLRSQTGIFVDESTTGVLVGVNATGDFIDTRMTGQFVGTGISGQFVGDHETGIFVDIHTSGTFVGDHETGNFLTELSRSGTYSTQFDITVQSIDGGNRYLLSEVVDGSHAETSQVDRLVINLQRGNTYKFRSSASAASHPFHIVTGGVGGNYDHEYTSGVTNSRAAGEGQSLIFRVPQNAPERLGYQCGLHANMGSTINVWDNTGSLVGTGMTGSLVDNTMTGFVIGNHDTGAFYPRLGGDISGNVSVLGSSGLYVSGDIQIQSGVSYHSVVATGNGEKIDWSSGNIQFQDNSSAVSSFDFLNAKNGQTLTLYVKNTTASDQSVNFVSGTPNAVMMPADADGNNTAPKITANRTNVYTFVRIHTGIFTSYVTGYDYR